MKGWVYIISNKSMPGLIKVGYSSKDPELRAADLNSTGSPHPYTVEYEMLIEQPEKIEGLAHKALSQYHEGKEWFRCTVEEGIAAIQRIADNRAINQSFRHADREKADEILQNQKIEEAIREAKETTDREIINKINEIEKGIREKYDRRIQTELPKRSFWGWWILSSGIFFIAGAWIGAWIFNLKEVGALAVLSAICGGLAASFLKTRLEDRDENSNKYKSIIQERDEALETAKDKGRNITILSCPNCKKKLHVSRSLVEKTKELETLSLKCPFCSHIFECQRRGDVLISISENNEYISRIQAPDKENESQRESIRNAENKSISCPHCRKRIGFSPYFIERNLIERFNLIKCPFCSQEFTCEKKDDFLIAL